MGVLEIVGAELRVRPRRWLVTGAAGFIGSHLLEWLLRWDQDVVGLDNFATGYEQNMQDARERAEGRGRFRFIEGDIRDAELCVRACEGVDYVLHQAALGSVPRSIDDPLLYHQVNVDGFLHMLLAAREAGVERFVYASSSAVYGDHAVLPKRESEIGTAMSPYGLTKRLDEDYGELFRSGYGVETVGLRYFNVFGRRQDPGSTYAAVIPHWVRNLLVGEQCYIHGDGETSRDFCYIDNVVQANVLAAMRRVEGPQQIYNVGVGDQTTLNQLFAEIRDGLATLAPDVGVARAAYDDFRPGDVRHSQADVTKIRTALGYEPSHTLREGLRETLAWYAETLVRRDAAAAAWG